MSMPVEIEEYQNIGSWLTHERQSRNLSIRSLAKVVGIPNTTLGQIEKGVKPSVNSCKKLAAYFGVSEDVIFRLAGYLGDETDTTPLIKTIISDLQDLGEREQVEIREYVRLKKKLAGRKN